LTDTNEYIEVPTYDLVGYEELIGRASSLVKSSSFPPVVLFHGREGIGKRALLKKISQGFLCETLSSCGSCSGCKRAVHLNHPDLLVMDEQSKTLKLEHAKEIQEHLSLSAGTDKYRVVLISDVERMNVQAVNRLLKIFEEPPKGSIILMSTSSIRSILDTLLSRSIKWFVRPPKMEVFQGIVRDECLKSGYNALSNDQFQSLARRSGFSPGKALRILEREQDLEYVSLLPILDQKNQISKSLDQISSGVKNHKYTPKEAVVEIEEQLNSLYREKLGTSELTSLNLDKLRMRRRILGKIRRATMSNETAYNVSMIFESVASC
jgi:DNA polymerase III delta prime subunit